MEYNGGRGGEEKMRLFTARLSHSNNLFVIDGFKLCFCFCVTVDVTVKVVV